MEMQQELNLASFKDNFRESFIKSTGIVGQILARKQELNNSTEISPDVVVRSQLNMVSASYERLHQSFIQIAENFESIASILGAQVTLQQETDAIVSEAQKQRALAIQKPGISKDDGEKETSNILDLFDRIGKRIVLDKKRQGKLAKKVRKQKARNKRLSRRLRRTSIRLKAALARSLKFKNILRSTKAAKEAAIKLGKKAVRFVPVVGQVAAVGIAAYEGYQGAKDAEKILDIEGREATGREKFAAGTGAVISSLTFGLVDEKAVAKKLAPTPAPISKPSISPPTQEPAGTGIIPGAAGLGFKLPSGLDNQELVSTALDQAGITNPKAKGNILAQVAAESGFKPRSEELGKYSAKTLYKLYGPEQKLNKVRFRSFDEADAIAKAGGEAIGDVIYGGRMGNMQPGDGFKYRGRGFIQLTGKDAYAKMGRIIGEPLESNPDLANKPEVAAKIVPAFFLAFKGKRPEQLEDINTVNKLVGAADPRSREKRVQLAQGFEMQLESKPTSGADIAQQSAENAAKKKASNQQNVAIVNITNIEATKKASSSSPRSEFVQRIS